MGAIRPAQGVASIVCTVNKLTHMRGKKVNPGLLPASGVRRRDKPIGMPIGAGAARHPGGCIDPNTQTRVSPVTIFRVLCVYRPLQCNGGYTYTLKNLFLTNSNVEIVQQLGVRPLIPCRLFSTLHVSDILSARERISGILRDFRVLCGGPPGPPERSI